MAGAWRVARLAIVGLVVASSGTTLAQNGPVGESTLHQESVVQVVDDLEPLIRAAVESSGGDLERQHAHWAFAFSTGHFPGEPIRAQAARETALQLLDRLAVPGDRVSSYAFEMGVWDHPGSDLNPILLEGSADQALDTVARSFPLTAQSGSQGGHDTELALVQVAEQLDLETGPIIVLLANRAASITTDSGERPLIGSDAQVFRSFLDRWYRVPVENRSGASYEATYRVTRWNGEVVSNTLDIVLLVPDSFQGPATGAPRTELRGAFSETMAEAPAAPAEQESRFPYWTLLLVAAAGAAIYLAATGKFRKGQRFDFISIDDQQVGIESLAEGVTICRLVPRTFVDDDGSSDTSPAVRLSEVSAGTEILGRFVWVQGRVTYRDGAFRAVLWNGSAVRAPVVVNPPKGRLEIEGDVREGPALPPRKIRTTIHVEMGKHQ